MLQVELIGFCLNLKRLIASIMECLTETFDSFHVRVLEKDQAWVDTGFFYELAPPFLIHRFDYPRTYDAFLFLHLEKF